MAKKIIAIHSIVVRTRKEFWPKADLSKHFTTWMQESKDAHLLQVAEHKRESYAPYMQSDRLLMASGLSISIQASHTHYCTPRTHVPCAEYTEFELGYPNWNVPALNQWEEECGWGGIYPYTPKEVIEEVIAANGGVVGYDIKKWVD